MDAVFRAWIRGPNGTAFQSAYKDERGRQLEEAEVETLAQISRFLFSMRSFFNDKNKPRQLFAVIRHR
jgi:hypothetical protein